MRVAYLVSEYPARSHTFIRREIEALRSNGFEICSFSLRRYDVSEILNELEQQEYDNTWSVFPVNAKSFVGAHIGGFFRNPLRYLGALTYGFSFSEGSLKGYFYTLAYFLEAIYLSDQFRKSKIEAAHVHFANSGSRVVAVATKYLNIPWMLSLHGSVDFEVPGILWLKPLAKAANSIRCVSDYGASQVMRVMNRSEYSKIFVSNCGLPNSYLKLKFDNTKTHDGPLKLLSVGRLSPEKGQFLLIEAAHKLKNIGVDYTLDIIGDGPDSAALKHECSQLNLESNLNFLGSIEEGEVLQYMREADIFLCTSFMEGLPQVLMESMLVGTPVVAPFLAGIPELVDDDHSGMLFPAGNVDTLVKKILKLSRDKHLYESISVAGRAKIIDQFIISKTIQPLISKTHDLLALQK